MVTLGVIIWQTANFRNHLRFNLRCLHSNVTPQSIQLTSNVKGYKAERNADAERKLLNERIRQNVRHIESLEQKSEQISVKLSNKLVGKDLDRAQEFITQAQLRRHEKTKQNQIHKFDKLSVKKSRW